MLNEVADAVSVMHRWFRNISHQKAVNLEG